MSPSGNTTTYTDVVFPSVQLPSQTCGDRNGRCDVSVFTIDGSTRVAVLVAVGNGTIVALFDRLNNGLYLSTSIFFLAWHNLFTYNVRSRRHIFVWFML